MLSIYKYDLIENLNPEIPQYGKILCVQMQNNHPCIWVQVNPDSRPEQRHFKIVGTGHKVDCEDLYIGTVQDPPFVWHVYETAKAVR